MSQKIVSQKIVCEKNIGAVPEAVLQPTPEAILAQCLAPSVARVGFADPVHDAQTVFRAVLAAMSRPGSIQPVCVDLAGAPFCASATAVLLALADHETTVWFDPSLANRDEAVAYLRFATGTRITDNPKFATYALVSNVGQMLRLDSFAQGTPEYPDRSTTVIVIVEQLASISGDGGGAAIGPSGLRLSGPGIEGVVTLSMEPSPPADFSAQLRGNRAGFPCGVDLIMCAGSSVAALPRSVRTVREA